MYDALEQNTNPYVPNSYGRPLVKTPLRYKV